jgi:protein AroM
VAAVGAVTIGQSPRSDVLPEMTGMFPAGTRVIERGALDRLGGSGLAGLAPRPGQAVLVTRLRGGREVTLAEAAVLPLVQAAVDQVCAEGASVVALLCTGSLTGLRSPVPLLMPGPLTRNLVAAIAGGTRLGVIVPAAGQAAAAHAGWAEAAGDVRVESASPYGRPDDLAAAAEVLARSQPGLVVLDCLGFDRPMQRRVRSIVGVPVVLPRIALAGAAAALL